MRFFSTIFSVLRRGSYLAITALAAFVVFTIAVVLIPNVALVGDVLGSSSIDLASKLKIISSLSGAIFSNSTLLSGLIIGLLSVLVGVNTALFVFVVRRKITTLRAKETAESAGGILGGLLGVGCAACGSLILTAALPTGLAAFVASLPLAGQEIGLIGIALVGVSIYSLTKRLETPVGTCPV